MIGLLKLYQAKVVDLTNLLNSSNKALQKSQKAVDASNDQISRLEDLVQSQRQVLQ